MYLRYEEAPQAAYDLLKKVIAADELNFGNLAGAKILLLMDLKKRATKGKITFASIKTSAELERFLSVDDEAIPDGYDYIIRLDKMLWNHIEDVDRTRLLRHELRHADVHIESDTPFKTRGHTVEDFYSEIEYNRDDPKWDLRLATLLTALYEGKNVDGIATGKQVQDPMFEENGNGEQSGD